MKPVMMTLLAGTVLAASLSAAVPAAAQMDPRAGYGQDVRHDDRGGWNDNDWRVQDWSNRGYAGFTDEYQRIQGVIQHGLRDGTLDRRQADVYLQQVRNIRYRADVQQRRGAFDPRDTQLMLQRLLDRVRIAHERGHERQNRYGNGRYDGRQGGGHDHGYDQRQDPRYDNRPDDRYPH